MFEGLQLPMDLALAVESRYFAKILRSKEAAAMIRSLFVSKGELDKGARRPKDVAPTTLKKIGVLGAGFMGAGIAYVAASAGLDVVLIDRDQLSADKGKAHSDKLISAQTSVGGKVQLRAPAGRHSGTMTMRTVPDIPLPANSMTLLNPDSFHLLITGAGAMHDGKDIMLRLTFANAGTVTVIAMVTDPESGGSSYFLN